jgi:hypothetical protein
MPKLLFPIGGSLPAIIYRINVIYT